jgi:hypothetical protein
MYRSATLPVGVGRTLHGHPSKLDPWAPPLDMPAAVTMPARSVSGTASCGRWRPTAYENAEADAAWPQGNDQDLGIST